MVRIILVFSVGIVVGSGIQSTVAQSAPPNVRFNHVALSVQALQGALKFYQDKLGFNEVIRYPNGISAYIQVSRETFIELQVANAERPAGRSPTSAWRRPTSRQPSPSCGSVA